ncbi:MAG: hypothetical protein WKF85_04100 [Chitinophagaceae bacterium]
MKIYTDFEPTGDETADGIMQLLFSKLRYQLMWRLRKLELEINNEPEGVLIIRAHDGIDGMIKTHVRGFSDAIMEKISERLKDFYFADDPKIND